MDLCRQNKYLKPEVLGKKIAIIGMGALGSHVLELLVRSGLKNFLIMDSDVVEEHNLHRQNFNLSDVGKPKVSAAKENMKKINPNVEINIIKENLNQKTIQNLDSFHTDLIVDCKDNLTVRFLINEY